MTTRKAIRMSKKQPEVVGPPEEQQDIGTGEATSRMKLELHVKNSTLKTSAA